MKKKTIWITGAAVAAVLIVGGAGLAIADPFDNDGPLTGSTLDKASAAALDAAGSGTVTGSDAGSDDDAYAYEVEVTLADGTDVDVALDKSFAVLWVDGLPTGAASAAPTTGSGTDDSGTSGTDDSDLGALSAADRDAASAAALATLPAGTVGTITEVERSDDFDHAYEVEITLENGQDVDVELDASFAVVKVDGAPTA
ncbi:PepSY domain-containing protein [Cryobacterium lactosi]|uniref:PepSY domain-containing protein n=1 Tax=Cryobacterium lactosi TaxID=1259202 RepID=UPI0015801BDA|nr:PepSY domain-containing protein [Cryobacterium lactosi]